MDINLIKEIIKKSIDCKSIDVVDTTGTSDHFKVVVISDMFQGMSLVDRHKLVYKSLEQYLTKEIHALQLVTKTKEEESSA